MKKRRSMVLVVPGKDVTVYIPTDTPPEVIRYLNRLKTEGNFSQGIMDILIEHIVQQRPEAEASPFEDSFVQREEIQEDASAGIGEIPAAVEQSPAAPKMQKAFSPEEIIRQATRNAGKLLTDRRMQD